MWSQNRLTPVSAIYVLEEEGLKLTDMIFSSFQLRQALLAPIAEGTVVWGLASLIPL